MSDDWYSFMTGISSYNSQLTPTYLLDTEKRGKQVLLFVFNMAFPTSPFEYDRSSLKTEQVFEKTNMISCFFFKKEDNLPGWK